MPENLHKCRFSMSTRGFGISPANKLLNKVNFQKKGKQDINIIPHPANPTMQTLAIETLTSKNKKQVIQFRRLQQ